MSELVKKLSEDTGVSQTDVKKVMKSFIATIKHEAVNNENGVIITGFAKFKAVEAKEFRNPKTNEIVQPTWSKNIKVSLSPLFKRIK